jgi:hypothetical protein
MPHSSPNPIARLLAPFCLAVALAAQPTPKPFQAQSASSISLTVANKDEPTLKIANTVYEMAGGGIPGLPAGKRLVLRKTTRSTEVIGDMDIESAITVEAWPFGADLKQKPLYSLTVSGTRCDTIDSDLLVVSRGLAEVEWWSAYRLGTGARLFDTYVPLVKFSISRDTVTTRYVGLEVPEDDAADARLKEPHVVAVLTYASAERVMREVLVTASDPKQAAQLRSFADEAREVTLTGHAPALGLKLSFSQSYPAAPQTVTVTIPIVHDDLNIAHAQVPAGIHLAAWKR